jgi:LysR family transcriptional regulator (chromosome initiation inhibitor)
MKRPDYRTLQALDAVIRERGFERAAQKLCITQSAVSQRIKQLENMFGQPLLGICTPRPTEQGQKLLALLRQVELLEDEWLGDEQTGSTPLLLSLAVNADSLATWLLPALAPVLADSPIRLNLQVEDETCPGTPAPRRSGGCRQYSAASAAKLPCGSARCAGLPVCGFEGFRGTLF